MRGNEILWSSRTNAPLNFGERLHSQIYECVDLSDDLDESDISTGCGPIQVRYSVVNHTWYLEARDKGSWLQCLFEKTNIIVADEPTTALMLLTKANTSHQII